MNRLFFTVMTLVVGAFPVCAQTVNIETERAALLRANVEYCQHVTAKDGARLAATYSSNASMFPPNEGSRKGTAGRQAWASEFMATPGLSIITCSPVQADVSSSGDLGYTLFIYDLSYRGADGQTVRDRGRDLLVWRKQADG